MGEQTLVPLPAHSLHVVPGGEGALLREACFAKTSVKVLLPRGNSPKRFRPGPTPLLPQTQVPASGTGGTPGAATPPAARRGRGGASRPGRQQYAPGSAAASRGPHPAGYRRCRARASPAEEAALPPRGPAAGPGGGLRDRDLALTTSRPQAARRGPGPPEGG